MPTKIKKNKAVSLVSGEVQLPSGIIHKVVLRNDNPDMLSQMPQIIADYINQFGYKPAAIVMGQKIYERFLAAVWGLPNDNPKTTIKDIDGIPILLSPKENALYCCGGAQFIWPVLQSQKIVEANREDADGNKAP